MILAIKVGSFDFFSFWSMWKNNFFIAISFIFVENLKELDDYILRFNGKVRLIRNSERQGLIRTRSRGAVEARGEVIVFLDAHCEVNKNWLPPLLAPIYYDR